MDKEVILWIFGILITGIYAVTGGGIAVVFMMVQRMSRMEATLEFMGYAAAKAAHSPHNPELDVMLEKYYRAYEEKHYDLSNAEWDGLSKACEAIIGDISLPNGYRAAVGIVLALCKHKKMRLRL